MTVQQLIKALQKFDQNKPVVVSSDTDVYFYETLVVEEDRQDVIIIIGDPSDCK